MLVAILRQDRSTFKNTGDGPLCSITSGIFFDLPFQKGRSKKIPPQKTQEIPGFLHVWGAKKYKVFP